MAIPNSGVTAIVRGVINKITGGSNKKMFSVRDIIVQMPHEVPDHNIQMIIGQMGRRGELQRVRQGVYIKTPYFRIERLTEGVATITIPVEYIENTLETILRLQLQLERLSDSIAGSLKERK